MKCWISVSVIALLALAVVQATIVQDCKTGENYSDTSLVRISDCELPACRLRKKHDIVVEAKFKTNREIKNLKNSVNAMILGIPFPFIGVDGTSACRNIYQTDGTKVDCPLAANKEYLYKNSFKVLDIYPKLKTTVHWALTDPKDNSEALCFNVNVKITS